MQAPVRQAGGGRDGVLLGDAHVVDPIGEALGERRQPGRAQHRSRHRDHVAALLADGHERVGEHIRPASPAGGERLAGRRIDLADGVELIGLVIPSRLVAPPLLGDRVDDDRAP